MRFSQFIHFNNINSSFPTCAGSFTSLALVNQAKLGCYIFSTRLASRRSGCKRHFHQSAARKIGSSYLVVHIERTIDVKSEAF